MHNYYVVNPITRQSVTLPRILNPITRQLIFDSYEGEGWVGGFIYRYDINHDQLSYRVVLICGFNRKLKKLSWIYLYQKPVNGGSQWWCFARVNFIVVVLISYKNLLFWWDSKHGRLIGFDPYNNARYRLFEHPKMLGVCRGCLRVCQIFKNPERISRLWELKD